MARRYRFRFKTLDVYQAAVQHFAWTVQVVARRPQAAASNPERRPDR